MGPPSVSTTLSMPLPSKTRNNRSTNSFVKGDNEFNNSEMSIIGSAWASGGGYIYSALAYSNGNLFVGGMDDNDSTVYNGSAILA